MLFLWVSSYFTKSKPTYIKYLLSVHHYHGYFHIKIFKSAQRENFKIWSWYLGSSSCILPISTLTTELCFDYEQLQLDTPI